MTDGKGNELKVGDRVLVEFEVKEISDGGAFGHATLATTTPAWKGTEAETQSTVELNTQHLIRKGEKKGKRGK